MVKAADDRGASVGSNEEALDEFEQAFDLALNGTSGAVSDDATLGDPDEDEPQGTAGTSGEDSSAGMEESALTEDPIGTAGTTGKVEDYEQKYKTLQGIVKSERKAWEKERAKLLSSQQSPTGTAGTTSVVVTPLDKRNVFLAGLTEEQKAQLSEYEKEFSVISKMEGMKREFELDRFKQEFSEFIVSKLNEIVLPIAAEVDRTTEKGHFAYLKEQHPDYEELRDNGTIEEWINLKPAYLRKSLMDVYLDGEAEDVAAMLTDFKRENNLSAHDPAKVKAEAQAAEIERQKKADLEAKRKNKKEVLKSVVTKKGAVSAGEGPATDFEDAFDEALAVLT